MYREPIAEEYGERGFIEFLCELFPPLWKGWPRMQVTTLKSYGDDVQFSLVGRCPHCLREAVCTMVTTPYKEKITPGPPNVSDAVRFAAVTQCQGCRKYVLAVVTRVAAKHPGHQPTDQFVYESHYPVGAPDDSISEGIPEEIGKDFKEALRCRYVNAYKATVAMCGRALEGSCDEQKAVGNNLEDQIDDLAQKGIITASLQKWAHRIRLTRNRGVHTPDTKKQEQEIPDEKRADSIIEFTRQYFQHVYTMPLREKEFGNLSTTASSGAA